MSELYSFGLPEIVAGVILFRGLTYAGPILLGAGVLMALGCVLLSRAPTFGLAIAAVNAEAAKWLR